MPKMIFRGSIIRYLDVRRDLGGVFRRLHCTAEFSDPVQQEMGWAIPAGVQSAKLEGEVAASHLILTPDGELKQHEIQIATHEITDFQFVRLKLDDGESSRTELRFIVMSRSPGIAAIVEQYMDVVGDHAARMRVDFEKQVELAFGAEAATAS